MLGSLRKAREWATPTLKESAFLEKGVLTPDEFVAAGDELVYRCPTWSWESGEGGGSGSGGSSSSSSSKSNKFKAYLPPDKQYLITRNVPCRNRVSSMETNLTMNAIVEKSGMGISEDTGEEDDDWMVSSILKQQDDDDDDPDDDPDDDFDILDSEGEVIEDVRLENKTQNQDQNQDQNQNQEEEEDEYADMADYEEENILEDDDAAALPTLSSENTGNNTKDRTRTKNNTNTNTNASIVKVRTYDLSITYDKYYQTPRVWIIGRNPNDQPLTGTEMMQDVISDYANKTVTMESHPHVSGPHASIHPCQHAKVMKAIVRNLTKNKKNKESAGDTATTTDTTATTATTDTTTTQQQQQGPSVEVYLFIFLKFVSSMIPTINYDFTMDVTADTSK